MIHDGKLEGNLTNSKLRVRLEELVKRWEHLAQVVQPPAASAAWQQAALELVKALEEK